MKKCSRCGITKPKSEFHKRAQSRDGLKPMCKECVSKDRVIYYQKNKERILARNAVDRRANPIRCMYSTIKSRCKTNGVQFLISKDFYRNLVEETTVCPLLDIELVRGRDDGLWNSPSLDRKDARGDYTEDNVWVVSHKANTAKHNLTPFELLKLGIRNYAMQVLGDVHALDFLLSQAVPLKTN